MARGGRSGTGDDRRPRSTRIDGEPDPETGTLADWERYRDRLAALPQDDHGVRLAIAVAEARIAALRRAARRGGHIGG